MSLAELETQHRGPPRGLRADAAPGRGGGAERARRDAAVEGRDRRRRRGAARQRLLRPAHETVYEAVLDLYGRGEPADAVTVAAELTKRGELARDRRRAPTCTRCSRRCPTAANAGYYARIVRERAVLRRLVEAGTRIVQLGVRDRRRRRRRDRQRGAGRGLRGDRAPHQRGLPAARPRSSRARSTRSRPSATAATGMTGVPTGFADLDRLTNGLHAGPDDRHRGAPGRRQVHAGSGHRPVGVDQAQHDLR